MPVANSVCGPYLVQKQAKYIIINNNNNNNNTIYKAPFPKVTKRSENDRKKTKKECKQKPRGKPRLGKASSI